METTLKLFVIQLTIYMIITSIIYILLRKKNVIPEIRHPYTNRKDKRITFDFYNLMLFLTFGTVFLIYALWIPSLILYLLTVMQGYMFFLYIRRQQEEKVVLRIDYSEDDLQEWREDSKESDETKGKSFFNSMKESRLRVNKKPTKKIIITDDFIYFGKNTRDKVRIVPSFQKNFYLQDIKSEGSYIILSYGAMGSPMFKRYLFFPNNMAKEKRKFKKEVERIIKNQNA